MAIRRTIVTRWTSQDKPSQAKTKGPIGPNRPLGTDLGDLGTCLGDLETKFGDLGANFGDLGTNLRDPGTNLGDPGTKRGTGTRDQGP